MRQPPQNPPPSSSNVTPQGFEDIFKKLMPNANLNFGSRSTHHQEIVIKNLTFFRFILSRTFFVEYFSTVKIGLYNYQFWLYFTVVSKFISLGDSPNPKVKVKCSALHIMVSFFVPKFWQIYSFFEIGKNMRQMRQDKFIPPQLNSLLLKQQQQQQGSLWWNA